MSKEVVSHSLPPSDESYYDDEEEEEVASVSSSDDERADLREYGLAPSLPTTTAEAFVDGGGDGDGDGEIIVDESEGFSAALRYLASVRLEARTVPQTVVAEPRKGQERQEGGGEERETSAADRGEQAPPSSSSPPSLLPASASDAVSLSDPWLQAFLDDFAELRRSVTEAREVEHRDAWRLGAVEGRKKKKTEDDDEEEERLPRSWRAALGLSSRKEQEQQEKQQPRQKNPSARFLASLPQPEIVDALESIAEAVREFLEEEEEEEETVEEEEKEKEERGLSSSSSSSAAVITPEVALWTFSLAANLERPVPPHASAALFALGKAAGAEAKRRRRRRKEEKEEEEEASSSSSSPSSSSSLAASSPCPHAAVVAAVCGAYFVQCEVLSRAAKEGWP